MYKQTNLKVNLKQSLCKNISVKILSVHSNIQTLNQVVFFSTDAQQVTMHH